METYGGQAVIEGVMMRSQEKYAIAVRKEGKIIVKNENLRKKKKFLKLVFIRGIANLIEMLVLGMNALVWSTNQQSDNNDEITFKEIITVLVMSIGFGILFFAVAPFLITRFFMASKGVLFNLIEGAVRITIFVVYILLISLMRDIQVLFQYHGAEHKIINLYESGKKVNTNDAMECTTLHRRCGTSFILIVLIMSILFFSLINLESFWARLTIRIILIPVIASVSYEIIKLGEKYKWISFFSYPGLLMQKITTREPTQEQVEVAAAALNAII